MSNINIIKKYANFINDNEFMKKLLSDIDFDKLSDQKYDFNEEIFIFSKTPDYVKNQLRDYQLDGLNWLIKMHEKGMNCILADEMGLGKTLQSISLLGYLKCIKNIKKKHLVIVPKSCLQNWEQEFKTFVPSLNVKVFHTSKAEINEVSKELFLKKVDVILTTYEMCIFAKKIFKKIDWYYVIIDEAHRLKNENSKLNQIIRLYNFKQRLLLTGTPLQNNIHELWALLNFIIPEVFSDSVRFENYVLAAGQEEKDIDSLRNVLQLFLLRREKLDVEHSLKPKKTINIYCPLSEMQRNWYKSILKRDLRGLTCSFNPKNSLLNIVMQLRKCCNHPYLFEGAEPTPYETGEHLIENSGKMIILDKLLKQLKSKGSRVLIFSQMAMMIDILEDYANYREWEYSRIDGKTSVEERTSAINEFNAPNSDKFIFLLTTRAGGLGINLYTADTVVIFDSDWNPQADLQAQDRAHRIGQKNVVNVFRFMTENTIEEGIILRAQKKLKLDDILMQGKKKVSNLLSQNELMEILFSGLNLEESKDVDQNISIEEVLRRGEEKTREMNEKLDMFKIGDENTGRINMYQWEGEDYLKKKFEMYVGKETEARTPRSFLSAKKKYKKLIFPDYQFYPKIFYELQDKEEKLFEKNEKLTEEEENLKEECLQQGFNWTRKDFKTFVNAVEHYGRDLKKIKECMPNKDDVEAYYNTFWERYEELTDKVKIMSSIQKNELKLKNKLKLKKIFRDHFKEVEDNILTKNRLYIDNSYLLKLYSEFIDDPDCFEKMKLCILDNDNFMFDYFLFSRNTTELAKHINVLSSQLLKAFPDK